jgi:hypothetical protein
MGRGPVEKEANEMTTPPAATLGRMGIDEAAARRDNVEQVYRRVREAILGRDRPRDRDVAGLADPRSSA